MADNKTFSVKKKQQKKKTVSGAQHQIVCSTGVNLANDALVSMTAQCQFP